MLGAVGLLVLAGCDGGTSTANASPSISEPPPATQVPTPTTSPTPATAPVATTSAAAATVIDRSDPALGLTFGAMPQASGQQVDALNTLSAFDVAFWRSRTSGAVTPEVKELSTGAALANARDVVGTNKKNGWSTSGSLVITYTDVAGTKELVVVDLCVDARKVEYSKGGKVTSGADLPDAQQKVRAEVAVQPQGGWAVQSYATGEAC